MGCQNSQDLNLSRASKPELPKAEVQIREHESALGYEKISVLLIKFEFSSISEPIITIQRLSTIFDRLGVNYDDYHDASCGMGEMFKAMESGNDFSTTKFYVMGLMLGQGNPEETIGLLFDVVDLEGVGEIAFNQCQKLIVDMIYIAI